VSFTAITLCVASQRVLIIVVYFVIDGEVSKGKGKDKGKVVPVLN
jgi:hypothetical protein